MKDVMLCLNLREMSKCSSVFENWVPRFLRLVVSSVCCTFPELDCGVLIIVLNASPRPARIAFSTLLQPRRNPLHVDSHCTMVVLHARLVQT